MQRPSGTSRLSPSAAHALRAPPTLTLARHLQLRPVVVAPRGTLVLAQLAARVQRRIADTNHLGPSQSVANLLGRDDGSWVELMTEKRRMPRVFIGDSVCPMFRVVGCRVHWFIRLYAATEPSDAKYGAPSKSDLPSRLALAATRHTALEAPRFQHAAASTRGTQDRALPPESRLAQLTLAHSDNSLRRQYQLAAGARSLWTAQRNHGRLRTWSHQCLWR